MKRLPIFAAAFTLVLPLRAHAQANDAAATALFDEGRKLMAQHRYTEACPKFAESQRLAPSGGTLLNLGECYEHTGQTASAWVAWKDAAARANAAGKTDVEKKALTRASALEPGLARLTIAIAPDSKVPGLEVKRDGVVVGPAEYGLAIPVDPGTHTVEARAPKKKEWTTKVDVAAKQADAHATVSLVDEVPPASAAAAAPEASAPAAPAAPNGPPPPEQATPSTGNTQRTVSLIVLGAGVVGVGVGSAFGLVAMSKNNEALKPENCRTAQLCTPMGLSLTGDAKDAATISTVAFAVGGAALATGLVLWLTSPRTAASAQVAPLLGPSYAGVSFLRPW
jgi:serine/threonine-protein kinase